MTHGIYDIDVDVPTPDDRPPRPDDGRCFLMRCGEPATVPVDHEDRGTVWACGHHAERIQEANRRLRRTTEVTSNFAEALA